MKKLFFLILIFSSFGSNAQSYDDNSEASELCLAIQGNSFINDKEADVALDKILSVIGASKRFIMQPCSNIDNAVATSYKGLRYILYDKEFMNTIAENTTAWSELFILAHEVGHHINGHSIDILLVAADVVEPETLASKRQQELESDEFAGFILGKLGATLEQTSEAINLLASNKDDTYSTHPNKSKRLNAIRVGYDKAFGKKAIVYDSPTKLQTAEEYFYSAYEKVELKDYYGAIEDYTKAIELDPNYANAYYNRGIAKQDLRDNYGAIEDYTKAIELDPNYANAYNNRGIAKQDLRDNYGAIADYTILIKLEPNNANAYYNRGIAKQDLKDYNGAVEDFTKVVELDPNYAKAYYNRGIAKQDLKDYYGAITDLTKAIGLDPNYANYYLYRGLAKYYLKDHYGAIADFTKVIDIDPDYTIAYFNRGLSKKSLGDLSGTCTDFKKAANLGDKEAKKWIINNCK